MSPMRSLNQGTSRLAAIGVDAGKATSTVIAGNCRFDQAMNVFAIRGAGQERALRSATGRSVANCV